MAAGAQAGGPSAYYVPGPIKKLPNGGRPLKEVPFPAITEWGTLKITLERTMCFGTCPAYSVEIIADGTVRYKGSEFVAVSGKHEAHIPANRVRALYDAFVKAEFFWTFDEYHAEITDFPAYRVTIAFDGNTKRVVDYAGRMIGMPKEITDLEDQIDTIADTNRWTKGDENTFASLVAEHWDFRARDDEHLALIASAARSGSADLVRKLLAAGVGAKNRFGCKGLEEAVRGSQDIVDALMSAGAPVHWDASSDRDYDACDVLGAAAEWGVPSIVHKILAVHPNINWKDSTGTTALMRAAGASKDKDRKDEDYGAVVRMLIGAGADVNLQNRYNESAIMMVREGGDIVRALLAAGAKDINKRDSLGETTIMRSYDPDVTQALLDGGADPWIVDNEGKNALKVVRETYGQDNGAVAVLKRWMSAHPNPH